MDRSVEGASPTDERVGAVAPQAVLVHPLEEAVRLAVASAPPLTLEQRASIVQLLGAVVNGTSEHVPWVAQVAA